VLDACQHFPKSVFVGGATVVETANTRQGCRLLRSVTMQPDLARELSADLESLGHAVLALQESFLTGIDYCVTSGVPLDESSRKWMVLTKASVQLVPSLADFDHTHTLRVGIVASPQRTQEVNLLLAEKYGSRVITHAIAVPPQGVEVVEVFDPGVNKWAGVSFIADTLGIAREEVVAIGDDINDLAMLHGAGLGVAMGNARPEAKRAANRTIGPNAADGLAVFLEELIQQDRVAAA
jgi:hydroxymethylpyrimidine pyrophosphatase-like HAD family hydrolase